MPPELLEWGPAHLRDEAQETDASLDVEPIDRPDDN
jgi:hypothetical protein